MRDSLKDLFRKQIVLEDKSKFYYTIQPYQLTNMLGNTIAVLQEYIFTKEAESDPAVSYKLYKTKEGNWYDIEETQMPGENKILRMLKSAIDSDMMSV